MTPPVRPAIAAATTKVGHQLRPVWTFEMGTAGRACSTAAESKCGVTFVGSRPATTVLSDLFAEVTGSLSFILAPKSLSLIANQTREGERSGKGKIKSKRGGRTAYATRASTLQFDSRPDLA
jgi:hypothetical protein